CLGCAQLEEILLQTYAFDSCRSYSETAKLYTNIIRRTQEKINNEAKQFIIIITTPLHLHHQTNQPNIEQYDSTLLSLSLNGQHTESNRPIDQSINQSNKRSIDQS
ncbi:hypothetical protein SAMD00019534_023770, partial [Acytostelium subglobosum LB1]|uniref:hypothetical protein n=1 Tax=Acytostelium subglobosum LB1 TaxID=1410327 RepID=UPI000644C1AC